jgi:UDP-N-acetyl-D-glucosamine/UDP-N-acetyl-D-galactosamine dehydrogenase
MLDDKTVYQDAIIAVIGLGYVGLPLAVEFGKYRNTIGFDIDTRRIFELLDKFDRTNELDADELSLASKLQFADNEEALNEAKVYIVTVPTPIDEHNRPDLSALQNSCKMLGPRLNVGDIVIFESTVYPGATEEVCVPILEKHSHLKYNAEFFCGYSPERINPGDKTHRLKDIIKVTSGSNRKAASIVDDLYSEIIEAGTYRAESIKVAEAAKVIENTQRDINIALINEFSKIFNLLKIDTKSVLNAASTKWNFLNFTPGLVGGHCIGVDPYYLTHKAQSLGYHPELILSGRRINDGMSNYTANLIIKKMIKRDLNVSKSKILILGITFKENCPDTRNSKVVDLARELKQFGSHIVVSDPFVPAKEIRESFDIDAIDVPESNNFDVVILAVPHDEFINSGIEIINSYAKDDSLIIDLKSCFPMKDSTLRL